ncbi:MAG: putative dehydrogenase, partial [Glaciecola sp.]
GSVTISQISPGRRNRLWFEIDGAKGSASFNQQQPETAWLGTTEGATIVARDPATLGMQASGYATLPGGHPQGYHDCFDAFVADTYEAIRSGAPDGLPTVVDGLRSAQITDAVVASARSGTWVEVAS